MSSKGVKKKVANQSKDKSSVAPRTRNQKSAAQAVADHKERYDKLEAELDKLKEAERNDLFGEEDNARRNQIEKEMRVYHGLNNQMQVHQATSGSPDHHTAMEVDDIGRETTRSDAREQRETEQDVGMSGPNPTLVSANTQGDVFEDIETKQEYQEEPKITTARLVDDLDMAWDIDDNDKLVEPSLQHLNKEVFGHVMRGSQMRYCVRYGSPSAYSARFESTLPVGSEYKHDRDITQRSNRIVEQIVQIHKDKKEAIPMHILTQVKPLVVYWDSKMGLGHAAEVDVLDPDYDEGRRPNTRSFIYLDPSLYADAEIYKGIKNKSGFSHETRSTMKVVTQGNNDWQKSSRFTTLRLGAKINSSKNI